jgi:hypothetical protein
MIKYHFMTEKIAKTIQVPDGDGCLSQRIKVGIDFANRNGKPVVLEFNDHYLTIAPNQKFDEAVSNWDEMIKQEELKSKIRASQAEEDFGTLTIEF